MRDSIKCFLCIALIIGVVSTLVYAGFQQAEKNRVYGLCSDAAVKRLAPRFSSYSTASALELEDYKIKIGRLREDLKYSKNECLKHGYTFWLDTYLVMMNEAQEKAKIQEQLDEFDRGLEGTTVK